MRINELVFEAANLIEREDYGEAIVKLNHALVLDSNNLEVKKLILEAYFLSGDFNAAKESVDELLSLDDSDIQILYLRATFLNDLEEYSEGLETCNRILEIKSDYYLAYGTRGTIYHNLGERELAKVDFRFALKKDPNNPILLNQRAEFYIQQEENKLALKDLNKAIRINKNDSVARLKRAVVYRLLGKKEKALQDLRYVDNLENMDAEYLVQIGIIHSKNNSTYKAIEHYNKALNLDPSCISAYYSRALSYCKISEFEKALQDLEKAHTLVDVDLEDFILNGFAWIHFKQKSYKKAIEKAQEALEKYPEFFWLNLTLAETYGALEMRSEFLSNLQIAIKGGIGLNDIDESIRNKYANDKEYQKLTRKLKKSGPAG